MKTPLQKLKKEICPIDLRVLPSVFFYGESQPASDVNHIGKIKDNLELFLEVENDDKIIINKYNGI